MADIARHGGNRNDLAKRAGIDQDDLIDFSININPFGPPPGWRKAARIGLRNALVYPDSSASGIVSALALRYELPESRILVGNGSSELLFALARVASTGMPGWPAVTNAIIPIPSYVDYEDAFERAGIHVDLVSTIADGFRINILRLAADAQFGSAIILGQPNNPTGFSINNAELREAITERKDILWVIDESFADFVPELSSVCTLEATNLVVIRSLTKFFAIPGLRLGWMAADPAWIGAVRRQIPPWSVNSVAMAVGEMALADNDYPDRTRQEVEKLRKKLIRRLERIPGLTVYPGEANFLLVRLDNQSMDAHDLADHLLTNGIAIRIYHESQGLDARYFRIAVNGKKDNRKLWEAIEQELD